MAARKEPDTTPAEPADVDLDALNREIAAAAIKAEQDAAANESD